MVLRRLLDLWGDRDGAGAVEFALLAPALLLFLVGSFEIAMMFFVGSTLEAAVFSASRYGVTGSTDGGVSREARIREIIEERTFGFIDMDDAVIRTLVYPSFGDIGKPEPFTDSNRNGRRDTGEPYTDVNHNGGWDQDMGAAGVGGPGDIVLYEVEYQTTGITTLMRPILGTVTHRATVAVRNEPF
jgi:Flp pilus assembly pilin Flp